MQLRRAKQLARRLRFYEGLRSLKPDKKFHRIWISLLTIWLSLLNCIFPDNVGINLAEAGPGKYGKIANMNSKAKIAVFISGGGTNLQSLIDASKDGRLDGDIVLVVSNNDDAYGLQRAIRAGIDTFVYKVRNYATREEAHADLMAMLEQYRIDFIALAGYLKLLPPPVIKRFRNRITNIHPALLPQYGGKGMYGYHVHEAVIANHDAESGATVHLVDEIYDNGKILEQKKLPVRPDDTPDTLAARVLEIEHEIYPLALDKLIRGKYA